jgi:hypothetical protein
MRRLLLESSSSPTFLSEHYFFGQPVTLFRVDVLDLTIRLRLPAKLWEINLWNYRLWKRSHTLIAGTIGCNLGFHTVSFNLPCRSIFSDQTRRANSRDLRLMVRRSGRGLAGA